MDRDLRHLKLLSIFFYIVGGLLALGSCFFLLYVFMGVMFLNMPPPPAGGPAPPRELGWVFIIFFGAAVLIGWCWAAAIALAGWFLGKCRYYLFCMIMGGSALLFVPFGTILGVFTIILLVQPTVKRLFETGGVPNDIDEQEEDEDYQDGFRTGSYNIRR